MDRNCGSRGWKLSRAIKQIIVHCSATPAKMDIGADRIREWHKGRGWLDIGYHYVIRRNGALEFGRDLDGDGDVIEEVGAHAYGFNANSLGVCLIGGTDTDGKPESNFTFAQYQELARLVGQLQVSLPDVEIIGHRDLPGVSKDCPCFNVREFFKYSKVAA